MVARHYSNEPRDPARFTGRFDRFYTSTAAVYDWSVKALPVWKTWLRKAIPHITGPDVLEISFGTGYLMTQYAGNFNCIGLDYNRRMIKTARANLSAADIHAPLLQGDVASLPFRSESFDCVVNTMAFSGYPDSARAIAEMRRVLRPGSRLVMVDIGFPSGNNALGTTIVNLWQMAGDLVRNMPELLDRAGFAYEHEEIGGFGSVHLYVARRTA